MGLDTSHGCWHGAYSAFTRWRSKLAELAGYPPKPDGKPWDYTGIDWTRYTPANIQGEWEREEADPLMYLLAHSDCDGVIHPAQGLPLAKRLEGLLPLLPEASDQGHIGNWRETTQDFIDGLRRAAEAGEDVDFH